MLKILKKEALENILSMRFIIGFAVCNILFALGSYVFVQEFSDQLQVAQAKITELEGTYSEWDVYSQVQPTAIRKPSPMQVFGDFRDSHGLSPIHITRTSIPLYPEEVEEGFSLLQPNSLLNFPSISGLFLSLLAIIFTFDAVSGEKRRGSLRMILSCPISRAAIISGKVLGAVISLMLIIVSSMILFLLINGMFSPIAFQTGQLAQIFFIVLILLVYGAVFSVIGVFISSLCHLPSTSLISSLFVWVIVVVIVPVVVSQGMSRHGLDQRVRETEKEVEVLKSELMEDLFGSIYGALRGEYKFSVMFGASRNGYVQVFYPGRNCSEAIVAVLPELHKRINDRAQAVYNIENKLFTEINSRKETVDLWSSLNPTNALNTCLRTLSETDLSAHSRYLQQTREYRNQMEAFFNNNNAFYGRHWFTNDSDSIMDMEFPKRMELLADNRSYLRTPEGTKEKDAFVAEAKKIEPKKINLKEMPRFNYLSASIEKLIDSCLLQILSLVCLFALFFFAAFIRFLSYDVR